MRQLKFTIQNSTGLHARPAGELVKLCKKFDSDMKIVGDSSESDPKKIISVLSAGYVKGSEVEFYIEGEDEELAAIAIEQYMKNLID